MFVVLFPVFALIFEDCKEWVGLIRRICLYAESHACHMAALSNQEAEEDGQG